jgi:uncharacterized protein (TIGR00369 family)
MRAARLFKLFKATSLLTVGAGVGYFGGKFGLIYNPFYTRDEKILYQFNSITKEHQDFLKSHNFTEPNHLYDLLERRKQTNTFFEKALLSDLKAFQLLDFFVTKTLYDDSIEKKKNGTQDKKPITEEGEKKSMDKALACVFKAADHAQEHIGIIHGGLTATLIDSFFGAYAFMLNESSPVATTNLQIRYMKPLKTGNEYMLVCETEKIEGKHFFLKSYIRDPHGKVYCESTARFTKVNWSEMALKRLFGDRSKKEGRQSEVHSAQIFTANGSSLAQLAN